MSVSEVIRDSKELSTFAALNYKKRLPSLILLQRVSSKNKLWTREKGKNVVTDEEVTYTELPNGCCTTSIWVDWANQEGDVFVVVSEANSCIHSVQFAFSAQFKPLRHINSTSSERHNSVQEIKTM